MLVKLLKLLTRQICEIFQCSACKCGFVEPRYLFYNTLLSYNLVCQGNKPSRYAVFHLFAIDPKYFGLNGHNHNNKNLIETCYALQIKITECSRSVKCKVNM